MPIKRLLETCLLPPLNGLLLLAAGLLLLRRRPRLGRGLLLAGGLLLWLLATPLCSGALLGALQDAAPLPADGPLPVADAIVVISAEADRYAPEYGGAVAGRYTMQRLRYAAALQRRTALPVLTAGGAPGTGLRPLGTLMAEALQQEFGVAARWREDRSADTWQNAAFAAELLRPDGVRRVFLVTHAWHMPRARACFEAQGLEVVPAPTGFRGPAWEGMSSLLPSASGMRDGALALHEWLGRVWYAVLGR